MSRRAEPVHALARRGARDGCPARARCRGGRRAAPGAPDGRPARTCRRGRARAQQSSMHVGGDRRLVARLRRDVDQLQRPCRQALPELTVADLRRHGLPRYRPALLRNRRLGQGRPTSSSARCTSGGPSTGWSSWPRSTSPAPSSRSPAPSRASGGAGRRGDRRAVRPPAGPARRRLADPRPRSSCPPGATSGCGSATRCCSAAGCRSTRSRPPASRSTRGRTGCASASSCSPRSPTCASTGRRRRRLRGRRSASRRARLRAPVRDLPGRHLLRAARPPPVAQAHAVGACSSGSPRCSCKGIVDDDGGLWHRTLDELDACAAAYAAYALAAGIGTLGRATRARA